MVILPSLYLFWWKKRWQLLFGIIIVAVLAFSIFAPSEITYSILTNETEKEKPSKQLEKNLRSITDYEPKPSDSEKLKLEKSIVKSSKEIEKANEKIMRGEELSKEESSKIWKEIIIGLPEKKGEWLEKWGKKESAPALLFCGEEFNEELMREKKIGEDKLQAVEDYNVIDFGQTKYDKLDSLQKKIKEICQHKKNDKEKRKGNSPIIWFKNIDKITNSELKNELLKVVDPSQNSNLGKFQVEIEFGGKTRQIESIIDLSQFTLVATTSTTNPQLPSELKSKLKQVEPFFDKYFWALFFASGILEIIIFLLLIRSRRKSKSKSLKHLED